MELSKPLNPGLEKMARFANPTCLLWKIFIAVVYIGECRTGFPRVLFTPQPQNIPDLSLSWSSPRGVGGNCFPVPPWTVALESCWLRLLLRQIVASLTVDILLLCYAPNLCMEALQNDDHCVPRKPKIRGVFKGGGRTGARPPKLSKGIMHSRENH